jgi:hypothetical protein
MSALVPCPVCGDPSLPYGYEWPLGSQPRRPDLVVYAHGGEDDPTRWHVTQAVCTHPCARCGHRYDMEGVRCSACHAPRALGAPRDHARGWMRILPRDADDGAIVALVAEWVGLLAQERYVDALALLLPNGDGRLGPWAVRRLVEKRGDLRPPADAPTHRVTDPATATGDRAWEVVRWTTPGSDDEHGEVRANLPLDGVWSDLVATFTLWRPRIGLVLELADIRVG